MGAAGGVPSAPGGLRNTAGGTGQVSTFNPNWVSSGVQGGSLPAFDFGNRPKLGEGQQAKLEEQRALAEKLRNEPVKPRGSIEIGEAAPPEYQYYGNDNFGMLPKDYKAPLSDPKTTWEDREWDFSGIDKGWEQYDADYLKWSDPNQYRTDAGISDWDAYAKAAHRQQLNDLMGDRGGIPHAIEGDARDPYGYGSDYGRWYDTVYGKGALQREANKMARAYAENDPAAAGYEKGYGQIDWNDAAQVEDLFRRMNTGGTRTAIAQSATSQNKRTDMTEAGIMMLASMGMGALAAPAGASFLASQATPQSLAMQGISGLGQYA